MRQEMLIQQSSKDFESKTYISPCVVPILIVHKLKENLHIDLTYEQLKQLINNSKINITSKDIDIHLDEIKNEASKYGNKPLEEIILANWEEAKNFKNAHLKYYEDYLLILKQKIIVTLILIDGLIQTSKDDDVKYLINDLDITLAPNGYIAHDDVERICDALYENIIDLLGVLNQANSVTTYSQPHTTKLKQTINTNNLPTTDLQIKDIYATGGRGYIKLSKRQYDELMEKEISNFQKTFEIIKKEEK